MDSEVSSPFRFFDLPREVRDLTYTYLLHSVRKVPSLFTGGVTEGYIIGAPDHTLLHSSTQLSREYRKIAREQMHLVLAGYPMEERFHDVYPPIHSSLASDVRKCTVYLHMLCGCKGTNKRRCPAVTAIPFHQQKVTEFLSRLPQLRSVHVVLGLWAQGGGNVRWPLGPHRPDFFFAIEGLLRMPCVDKLDIVDPGCWFPPHDKEQECLTRMYEYSLHRRTNTQWEIRDLGDGSGVHCLPVLGSWSRDLGWH